MEKDTLDTQAGKPLIRERQFISDTVFDNSYFSYLYKKSEKIANAMYLLTSHFYDSEPLKWQIRSDACRLPKAVADLSLHDQYNLERQNQPEIMILTLTSGFETSFVTRLISEPNYRILVKELNHLYETLRIWRARVPKEQSMLGDSMFFDIGYPTPTLGSNDLESVSYRSSRASALKSYTSHDTSKRHSKGHSELVDMSHRAEKMKMLATSGEEPGSSDVGDTHVSARVGIIMGVLKSRGEVAVKDLLEFVSDCSEKTLQRELNVLIQSGRVAKRGERRWSRYSLVK